VGGRPLLVAGHLVCAAAGILAAAAIGPIVTARLHPPGPRWIVLNTACWVSVPWAYNDLKAPDYLVSDYASHCSSLLNFVWCNEYAGAHAPIFSDLGRGGFLEAHLFWLDRVASMPGVEGIIYANAPGATGNFHKSEATLVAIPVLERIRRDYPEAAPDVETYLRCLDASEGYRQALADCGDDWRDRVDLRDGTLRRRGDPKDGPRAMLKRFVDDQTEFIAGIRDCATETLIEFPGRGRGDLPMGRRSPQSARIVELLDACAARYLDPANRKAMKRPMKPAAYWDPVGGDAAWTAWANIVAKVCKARGIKLVYYIPPHLNHTDRASRATFEREYVDRVRRTFSGYSHVLVVDHADGQTLCQSDLLWHISEHPTGAGIPYNPGHIPNIIGRLKAARFLIGSLVAAGFLGDGGVACRYVGSGWPSERNLPATSLVLDYLPEPDQRKVEYYVETEAARRRSSPATDPAPGTEPAPSRTPTPTPP
jgi:hypothetical protein